MSREMTLTFRAAAHAQAGDQVPITLVTVTHPSTSEVVRLSSDPTVNLLRAGLSDTVAYGTLHKGEIYRSTLMARVWPDDVEGQPPRAQLRFAALTPAYAAVLRSIVTPAYVTVRMVLSRTPDIVQCAYDHMATTSAEGDASTVTIDMSREDFTAAPYPPGRMTSDRFPGLRS
ncbi:MULTISPECIES: hypothetical protein [unclassified Xanthobacter]|uniref:hypothetical protein n=1 Tax=unclassified Xanthobacter TaxID=2623496 RepID=UPI001EDD6594|nr:MULTISPECIES: hypothetical protein [unclassified Xanthobacter]